jgi:hypothetical protein
VLYRGPYRCGECDLRFHRFRFGHHHGKELQHNYRFLDEAGKIILEQELPTTTEGMKQPFARIPRSQVALETGTHSPWVSRLLTDLGHEVIVAHAQNGKSMAG